MLYCAHFSFDGRYSSGHFEDQNFHGYLDCLVEAESVEMAVQRLRTLLRERHRLGDLQDIGTIYLDAIIEVKSLPKKGVITFFTECLGEMPDTISKALFGTKPGYCNVYSFGIAEDEKTESGSEAIPFLEFDS